MNARVRRLRFRWVLVQKTRCTQTMGYSGMKTQAVQELFEGSGQSAEGRLTCGRRCKAARNMPREHGRECPWCLPPVFSP